MGMVSTVSTLHMPWSRAAMAWADTVQQRVTLESAGFGCIERRPSGHRRPDDGIIFLQLVGENLEAVHPTRLRVQVGNLGDAWRVR